MGFGCESWQSRDDYGRKLEGPGRIVIVFSIQSSKDCAEEWHVSSIKHGKPFKDNLKVFSDTKHREWLREGQKGIQR